MALKKWVACSDLHGDMLDEKATEPLFKFIDIWKPDIKIFAGDAWDFRALRKKATEEEKRESMRDDYETGREWIERFQPDFFVRGNHDERLWEKAAENSGILSDYCRDGTNEITDLLKKMGCRMLPYHKRKGVLKLGHLKILHGFASGIYASRQHALVYGSCLFGHTHAIDEHAIAGLERRVARNIGALCRLDMDYNGRQMNTLKQAHGWAYGVLNERTGDYTCLQAERIGGKWLLATEMVEL